MLGCLHRGHGMTYLKTITAHIAEAPHTTRSGAWVSAVQPRCGDRCVREVELRIPSRMRVRESTAWHHFHATGNYVYCEERGAGTRYHPENPWWVDLVLAEEDGQLGYYDEASVLVPLYAANEASA